MAVLDPAGERLELFTDSIGVGRLFQLRLPDGWVWSNRPVAALLFAGVMARAAQRGWRYAAACGWFMDDATPTRVCWPCRVRPGSWPRAGSAGAPSAMSRSAVSGPATVWTPPTNR